MTSRRRAALLAHGALVDLPNVMGVTPLMGARASACRAAIGRVGLDGDVQARAHRDARVLIAAGADVNATRHGHRQPHGTHRANQHDDRAQGRAALWRREVRLDARGRVLTRARREGRVVDALGKTPLNAALGQTGGRDNTVSPEIADMLRAATKSGG